jgi:hypothetical protein
VTTESALSRFGDLIRDRKLVESWEDEKSPKIFMAVLKPWADLTREFRAEGFYERFAAKANWSASGAFIQSLGRTCVYSR